MAMGGACYCEQGFQVGSNECVPLPPCPKNSKRDLAYQGDDGCQCDQGYEAHISGENWACVKSMAAVISDKIALLDAFIVDAAGEFAWQRLRGWNNGTDPCNADDRGGWEGVSCAATRITSISFMRHANRRSLRFTLNEYKLKILDALVKLELSQTAAQGTIPSQLANAKSLKSLALYSTALSGTLCLNGLSNLQVVRLEHSAVSGTLPDVMSPKMRDLVLLGTSISGTIPPSMGELSKLHVLELGGTKISGTIPPSLGKLTSLSTLNLQSTSMTGLVPDFRNTQLAYLHLGNCAFNRLQHMPWLPSTVSHVYLNNNPLDVTAAIVEALLDTIPLVHVFELAAVNIDVPLERHRDSFGTRVIKPTECRVGGDCAFRLDLYDMDDRPAHGRGLKSNMTLRLNTLSTHMNDNYNGSFTASIPKEWVKEKGPKTFQFFHNDDEFRPMMTGVHEVPLGADCPAVGGGSCEQVRTIDFLPRQCTGTHTIADQTTGSICQCLPGFLPYSNKSHNQISCHIPCTGEDVPSRDGSHCECTGSNYDTQATGIVLCVGSGSVDAALQFTGTGTGGKCKTCPACATCAGGVVTLHAGWRLNASNPSRLKELIAAGRNGRLQIALRCPGLAANLSACPVLRLTQTETTANLKCKTHHTGHLCAVCEKQFSLRESDNNCVPCNASDRVKSHFGISAGWFSLLMMTAVVLLIGSLYKLKSYSRVQKVKEELQTPCKILLGLMQVLALLKDVLNLVFPPNPRHVMSYAELVTVDVRSLVMFDCMGWTWYEKWWFLTLGVPCIAATIVAARYSMQRYTGCATARQNGINRLFFVVMLLYPQVSERIFSVLRCRRLGNSLTVLEVDYSVSCDNLHYKRLRLFAQLLVLIWPIGIPLGLSVLLFRQWRTSQSQWDQMDPSVIDQESTDLRATESRVQIVPVPLRAQTLVQFHYDRIEPTFAFCTAPYRAECFWFEPIDMVRKLFLTGLLQFVQRGSAEQVLVGCVLAFCSFGLQQRVQPYRESEANALKALVDTQIFLSFLICFILRVLPQVDSFEAVGADTYGDIFVTSLAIVVASAIGFVAKQVHRRKRFRHGLMTAATAQFELDVATTDNPNSVWSASTTTNR
jgi:Leucine-rich repeat (LRR) protein